MERACRYSQSLAPVERLRKAGVLSGNFWLATYFLFLMRKLVHPTPMDFLLKA